MANNLNVKKKLGHIANSIGNKAASSLEAVFNLMFSTIRVEQKSRTCQILRCQRSRTCAQLSKDLHTADRPKNHVEPLIIGVN